MSEINKILIPLAAAMMTLSACTWNDYEPLDFIQKTPQEINPQEYEARLAAVKEFKATEHDVMLLGMEGSASVPSAQPAHPMSMPDSADYLIIRNPLELHPVQAAELEEVYEKKGTKSLAYLDLNVLKSDWGLIQDQRAEDGKEPSSEEETRQWFADKTAELLTACDKYSYHGIVFSAEGAADIAQETFLKNVGRWMETHPDKECIFRGGIRNVKDQEMLLKCKYVIIIAGENSTIGDLTLHTPRILGSSKAKDRVLMEVTVPSSAAPQQVGATPQVAAEWVKTTKDHRKYTPRGVVVANADDDYYRNEMIFVNVRQAMSILNKVKE